MRVSYSGNTPVFQTGAGGPIPPTRSKLRPSPISVRNQQLLAMIREIVEGLRLAPPD